MSSKVTFTLDDETVRQIRKLAERSRKPQSLVVREAVAHYAARDQKATAAERGRQLKILEELAARRAQRGRKSDHETDRELHDIRLARRVGWRRSSD